MACAALQVECAQALQTLDAAPTLGIDLGVAAFAATSGGELVEPLRALVSRKVKGSANRKKPAARGWRMSIR